MASRGVEQRDLSDERRRLKALMADVWKQHRDPADDFSTLGAEAVTLADALGDLEACAQAHALLSSAHFARTEYHLAQRHALEALAAVELEPTQDPSRWSEVLEQLEDDTRHALSGALTALAISTFRLADYPSALLYASKELLLKRQLGDRRGEANALHGIGWGYDKVGLYQKALENHFQAIAVLEEVAPEAIGSPLNGVAATYVNLGSYQQALEYSRKAIEVAQGQPDSARVLSTALRCIGTIYHRLGDYQAARRHFEQSQAVSDAYGVALNQLSLGEMYLELGKYDDALRAFQECLADLPESARKRSRSQALIGIGNVYLARRQHAEAIETLREALRYAHQVHTPVEIYQAHRGLSRAYRRLGEFEKALEHFENFHHYQQQVMREASDVRTQVLMVQFDVERLQKDQEIHRLKHVELAHAFDELKRLHDQLEQQARELERLSNQDGLTGLFNRRFLDATLARELVRAGRYQQPLTVMIGDIDNFKEANDTFTHTVGDEVLRRLARLISDHTRETDVVARFGGEEFVVLFPNTALEQAVHACEKIREVIESYPWQQVCPGLKVTMSIGVATSNGGDTPETLLQRADQKLYAAKRGGKNQVRA